MPNSGFSTLSTLPSCAFHPQCDNEVVHVKHVWQWCAFCFALLRTCHTRWPPCSMPNPAKLLYPDVFPHRRSPGMAVGPWVTAGLGADVEKFGRSCPRGNPQSHTHCGDLQAAHCDVPLPVMQGRRCCARPSALRPGFWVSPGAEPKQHQAPWPQGRCRRREWS